MCSNAFAGPPPADLADRLGGVIDDLAAAAETGERAPGDDLAARLAAAWALIAAVDPELADRTAKYSGS
jgi:hypothetical protein